MTRIDATQIAAVRRFNRFYTRAIGVLGAGLSQSRFSLTEARILYELANGPPEPAASLGRRLGLDPGHLSRLLAGFQRQGLIARDPDPEDGRRTLLSLTDAGRAAFATLDRAAIAEMSALIAPLSGPARARLAASMAEIETLLGAPAPEITLRPPRAGEYGAIIAGHGRLYAAEYGFDETFEGLVAEIVASFLKRHDPARECALVADKGGAVVGSVFCVAADATTAKLRLLYVDEAARGAGLGRRLTRAAIDFARAAGYRRMVLWTNDVLTAARRIYENEGFALTDREPHRSFGVDLVGEIWERGL